MRRWPRPFVLRVCGSTGGRSREMISAFLDRVLSRRRSAGQVIYLFVAEPYTLRLADMIGGYSVERKLHVLTAAIEWHGLAVMPGEDGHRRTWDFTERMAEEGARIRVLAKELPATLRSYPRVLALHPRECRPGVPHEDMAYSTGFRKPPEGPVKFIV